MKKTILFFLLFALLSLGTATAQTVVGGFIYSNTHWTLAGSPYIVQTDIAVMTGATLTIDPGVTVKFDSAKSMQFFGTLRAKGTQSQPITFTSALSSPNPGDWGYILFNNSSPAYNFSNDSGSVMRYCTIQYAGHALVTYNGAVRINNSFPYLNNCTIQHNSKPAIKAWNLSSTLHVDSSTVQFNNVDTGAVYVKYGTLKMNGCNISNNITSLATSNSYSVTGVYMNNAILLMKNCTLNANNSRAIGCFKNNNIINTDSIIGNTITNNLNDGIYYYNDLLSSTNLNYKSSYILNNIIAGNLGIGIYYNYGGGYHPDMAEYNKIIINNNIVHDNTGDGIKMNYPYISWHDNYNISSNNIYNNHQNGIYFYVTDESSYYDSLIIYNNTIARNTANGIYFNEIRSVSNFYNISKNTINNNSGCGINFYKSIVVYAETINLDDNIISKNQGSGIQYYAPPYSGIIIGVQKNIIINNSSTIGGGINIQTTNSGILRINISQNVVAGNVASGQGGGIYIYVPTDSSNVMNYNTIINNTASTSSALWYRGMGSLQAEKNTIVYNKTTGADSLRMVYLKQTQSFTHNNLYNNSCNTDNLLWYDDYNGDILDAHYCYWRKHTSSAIDSLVWDYFDDEDLAIVDYSNFETLPDTAAPVTPVENVTKTNLGGGNIQLTWSPNLETDLAGYNVYWGSPTGYSFAHKVNAGNVNTYIISGVSMTDTIAVTAYDTQASGTDDQVDGHESWFSDDYNAILPPASAGMITGSTTVCQGQDSVIYTVPLITNATSYLWTLPTGATGSSSSNVIIVNYGNTAVSGNITVQGINACANGTASSLHITVNPLPANAGTITGLTPVCQGQSGVVYTLPSITYATSYVWALPTGATGTSATNTISVSYSTSATSGNITVNGHNSCGNGVVSTKAITVNPLPANAGTITGTTTLCQGQDSVTYTVLAIANATSYIWTLPTGATGTSSTNSIIVNFGSMAASGNITVKGNNSCGNGVVSSLYITVVPLPAANAGNDTTICQGASIILHATGGSSYTWNNGVTQGVAFVPLSTNTYIVTVSNGYCTKIDSIKVTVDIPPAAPVIYTVGDTLNSTASTGNQWYDDSGIIAGATSSTYMPTTSGHYYDFVTDANGCSSDTSNIIYIDVTGISGYSGDNMNLIIYPNPANDNLTIEIKDFRFEILDIRINDVLGNLILEKRFNNKTSIDVSALASGVYFIEVKTEKRVESRKFVKL